MINRIPEKQIIFNKYKLQKLVNISAYSCVYRGINIKSKELVSIKLENRKSNYNLLESEAYYLIYLKGFGIPNIISYGKSGKFNILIEELLGPSLNDILKLRKIKKKLPIKDTCMLALQALDRLEYIHSKNIIHQDIKPQNFLIGRKDPKVIYLIDFGFAKKYRSSRTGKHIKFNNLGKIFGSLAYTSVNGNAGYEQSRRDDLESLGYMLVFLAKNHLPWKKKKIMKNIEEINNSREEIYKMKKTLTAEKICEGLPEEFIDYLKYCRKLEFEQEPDYNYLKNLFFLILIKENQKNDLNFFWISKKEKNIAIKNDENNRSKRRNTHKRLYNSIKDSLEKKKSEKNYNTLESYDFKSRLSVNKCNDIQKKTKEKINYTLIDLRNQNNNIKSEINININFNNKNLIEVAKSPIKKYNNTNNNFENKLKIYLSNSQADNSNQINPESQRNINTIALNYNPHIQKEKAIKKTVIRVCDNIGIKNIIKDPIRKINIIAHNYNNVESYFGNKSQKTDNIILDHSYKYKNGFFNKADNIIKKNNMNYKTNSVINYRLKDRYLGIQNNKNRIEKINNINPIKDMERIITNKYTNDINYKPKYNNLSFLDYKKSI